MDTKENGEGLSSDSDDLLQRLSDRIEEMDRTLTDDEKFCARDIDSTLNYVETMEKKFLAKMHEFKEKLQQIREDNRATSEANREQFEAEIGEVNDLFSSEKHPEAWKKFEEYNTKFSQRSTINHRIPKLHMTEIDIEQLFSPDPKPNKPPVQSTATPTPTITILTTIDQTQDAKDETNMTDKDRLRQGKVIEAVVIEKDDRTAKETSYERDEPEIDRSVFGSRSKSANNQQPTTINGAIHNTAMPPPPVNPRPRFSFSTRLNSTNHGATLPPSSRSNLSTNSSIRNNYGQARFTPTPPNVICSAGEQRSVPRRIIKVGSLKLNPVCDYQHDQNFLSLMACNAQYIVLFKSRWNRSDKWYLGCIERRTHTVSSIEWHDGLITSMGYHEKNIIYMFTEREFFLYSLYERRKTDTRELPRGNDDEPDVGSQRGIGTVYGQNMYHIYLNRKSRWTLSKTALDRLTHMHDYDLTGIFPNVDRYIHFCINDQTMNFLVQMNDSSYAVVFCSSKDSSVREPMPPISLRTEKQPLTIYSAFIESLKEYIFFVNDPAIGILHILSVRQYIESYSIDAHTICHARDQHQLMIMKNNAICSINLNDPNLFFYIPANSSSGVM